MNVILDEFKSFSNETAQATKEGGEGSWEISDEFEIDQNS